MTKMFGDKYYEASDDDAKEAEKNKAIDMNLLKDEESDASADPEDYERMVAEPLKERAIAQTNQRMEEEGFNLWFVCDQCLKPIPEEMFRFDCAQCDNFTFC